jgi:DNA-binding CsgD family transcriptional regulator
VPIASGKTLDLLRREPEPPSGAPALCNRVGAAYLLTMFVGRATERAQIERLLALAREGRGSALLVRGEAGVGKTALLQQAAEGAAGFRLLRALGVESEAELPFAALHELVGPVVHLVKGLPGPQAKAIKAALALEDVENPDRFSVYAATLGLLAAAASERPLLCAVDDAHWLDPASAQAFAFAARRIDHEPIAMVFATRDPAPSPFSGPGLTELRLGGLPVEDAKTLVAVSAPSLLPSVVERLVKTAAGNPLALLEFAASTTQTHEGSEPLPVGEAIERSFLERSAPLSVDTRRALLLAAACDPGEQEALWSALDAEGISAESITEAERAGLLVRGRRLAFTHPLARSAIYHAVPPVDRRAAHRALAQATGDPDRRSWHLAAAAPGPDEQVAAALEEAANRALRRADVSAHAAALERAARLTPEEGIRARRLLEAGLSAEAAGQLERAEQLVAEAAELTPDEELRADAVARRSYLLFDRGELERALELATAEAERVSGLTAARVLTASGAVHALVHLLDIPAARAMSERAAELAGAAAHEDLDLCHMLAWTWQLSGDTQRALALARECADRVDVGSVLAIDLAGHFIFLEDYTNARDRFEAIIQHARKTHALGNLAYALDVQARLELLMGRPTPAYTASLEAIQLTEPLGNDVALASSLAWLALVEATLGRSEDAQSHGRRSLRITTDRGDRFNEVRARGALGLDALVRGDMAAAAGWLEPAAQMLAEGGIRLPNRFPIDGDLIEALVRSGKRAEASKQLDRLLENAGLTESRWANAVGARCRALLVDDAEADDAFESALELHEVDSNELEHARTQLAYGERLRRVRRRRDSREHLHRALEAFERLGARPWAERARAELRASGERLRPRKPTAHERLTPQELQVSLAAADGLTNKEIGARLFLSPKTVEFHLGRAYRKLDVRSRAELIKLFAKQAAPAERQSV